MLYELVEGVLFFLEQAQLTSRIKYYAGLVDVNCVCAFFLFIIVPALLLLLLLSRKREGLQRVNGPRDVQDNPTSRPVVFSNRLTKQVAMHCEMVGDEDNREIVARVSIVNKFGECVYDKYVKPRHPVANYRTWVVSGIRPRDLQNGESFETVQKEVAEIIEGKLLVGHAIRNDLEVLFLSHPQRMIRDTQSFSLFQTEMKTRRPSMKKLASHFLGIQIQEGEHSSVEDAKATMQLYLIFQKEWEISMMRLYSLTKEVAIDCEMVGDVYNRDMVARVSIVNKFGKCVYDKYVKPTCRVADYRTPISGIRPWDLQDGESFETVQKEVAEIIEGKILVGHDIGKDLKVLFLNHPQSMIRDTQSFSLFQSVMNNKRPSLKKLASRFLGIQIQEDEHSSVEDAMATMYLYRMYQKEWEEELSMMRL